MEKAQERILFLVLAGFLFFGQAIYDFIKKQKKSHTRRPAAQPKKRSSLNVGKQAVKTPLYTGTDDWNSEYKQAGPIYQTTEPANQGPDMEVAEDNPVIEKTTEKFPQATASDLRNAVIWNEILKRKF